MFGNLRDGRHQVSYQCGRLFRGIILFIAMAATALLFERHIALAVSDTTRESLGVANPRQVVADLETIVEKVRHGLHDVYLVSGTVMSGYYVSHVNALEISYDVEETKSLISPFTGVIKCVCEMRSNEKTFTTVQKALAATKPSDFKEPSTRQGVARWVANYAYQNGKWVFIAPTEEGWMFTIDRVPENQAIRKLFVP